MRSTGKNPLERGNVRAGQVGKRLDGRTIPVFILPRMAHAVKKKAVGID